MRKIYLILLSFLSLIYAKAQNYNLDSISRIDYQALHQANLNDCWGYTDETGVEYALVGTTKGTSIVSLADPANPQEIFWQPGTESIWRDLQVYNDYLYVTTEADDGLLIYDLSPLPQSTNLTVNYYFGAMGSIWTSAHDIFIDTLGGWAYICGANRGNGGMIILDIHTNPMMPIEVGTFDNWYCHDAYAQGNRLYGAHIGDGIFSIIDVTDHSNPILINTQLTGAAFTHNLWVTSDDKYVVTTDEVVGAFLDFYDITDPMNIEFQDKIQSSPGENIIPHNSFIEDDSIVYTSYYADGVTIHNMSRPKNVVQIGWYDTYPDQNSHFNGCWGVYPFLPSGLVLASDMQMGLFVLQPTIVAPGYYEGLVRDASNLNDLNGVTVKIVGDQNQNLTGIDGKFYVGTITEGIHDVIFNKVAYYPDTVQIDFQAGVLVLDTIDLVPIDPLSYTIVVTDAVTGDPIIGANARISNTLIDVDMVTDGFGEAQLDVYYPGSNKVVVGKWGYLTKCVDTVLTNDNVTLHYALEKGYYDDFSFDFGWTTQNGSATQGFWERGIPYPSGNISVPNEDAFFDCTNYCYVTGNKETLIANDDDVQDGVVSLISPSFDLSGYTDPYIYFEQFFFNWYGPNAFDDELKVSILNSTSNILVFSTEDSVYNAAWAPVSVRVLDYSPLEDGMQLRVRTQDLTNTNNVTEAAFDYFMITEGSVLNNGEAKTESFQVFPNPSSGKITISGIGMNEELTVYNSLGEQVYKTRSSKNGLLHIDLDVLDSGLYYVKYAGNTKKLTIAN